MKYKIVTDSSSNLLSLEGVSYSSVPLHVYVGDKDFSDDANVNVAKMQEALTSYSGKTSTACPSPADWLHCFEDADNVFCVTITGQLSGSSASANAAKEIDESINPGKKVYVLDSLSTGPEMVLIIEKLKEYILCNLPSDEIDRKIRHYCKHTHLYFSLASLDNFAKNGRINPLLAKGIGLMGIRIIGKASEKGTLQPLSKSRGDKKAIFSLIQYMKSCGYSGGRVVISHSNNCTSAAQLKEQIIEEFGKFNGYIQENRALCSYYAEPQSILLGFES